MNEPIIDTSSVYEQAGILWKEGKQEEAIQMIRDNLGEEAANAALASISGTEATENKYATADEVNTPEEVVAEADTPSEPV